MSADPVTLLPRQHFTEYRVPSTESRHNKRVSRSSAGRPAPLRAPVLSVQSVQSVQSAHTCSNTQRLLLAAATTNGTEQGGHNKIASRRNGTVSRHLISQRGILAPNNRLPRVKNPPHDAAIFTTACPLGPLLFSSKHPPPSLPVLPFPRGRRMYVGRIVHREGNVIHGTKSIFDLLLFQDLKEDVPFHAQRLSQDQWPIHFQ